MGSDHELHEDHFEHRIPQGAKDFLVFVVPALLPLLIRKGSSCQGPGEEGLLSEVMANVIFKCCCHGSCPHILI